MPLFDIQHPRALDGTFSEKPLTAPEAALPAGAEASAHHDDAHGQRELAFQVKDRTPGGMSLVRNQDIQNARDQVECTCGHKNVSHAYGRSNSTLWRDGSRIGAGQPDGSRIGAGQCGIDECLCTEFTFPSQPPLSSQDRAFGQEGWCGIIATEVHKRTGWPIVALTADGEGWVHAAVQLPDGRVLDSRGISAGGQHILDSDVLYGQFGDDELAASDGEVQLIDKTDDPLIGAVEPEMLARDGSDAPERAARIAETLIDWAKTVPA